MPKQNDPHEHKAVRTVEVCECGAARTPGGEWGRFAGRFAGRALVSSYLETTTHEERSKNARKAAKTRWGTTPQKKRSKIMREIARLPRPGRVIQDRCPCGKFSRHLAEKIKHKCMAPEGAERETE